jgi:UDP-glucose 4-epimerase
MHFLITGGLGFIGSHVAEQLVSEDHEVTIVDDLSSGRRENLPPNSRIRFVEKDILDLEITDLGSSIDGAAHLAAIPSVNASWSQARAAHDANLTSTLQVIVLCAALKIPRLVFASSAAVYGEPRGIPISENHATQPISPYGLQKLSSEEYGKLFAARAGFSFTSLRIFNAYGPRQSVDSPYSGVIARFLEAARAGSPATMCGDGSQTRDFVYVKDVAAAFVHALTMTFNAGGALVCNIGTGRSTSIRALAEYVGKFSRSGSLDIRSAPVPSGDIHHSYANISQAEQILGFQPHYSLMDGLSAMLRKS